MENWQDLVANTKILAFKQTLEFWKIYIHHRELGTAASHCLAINELVNTWKICLTQ